MMEEPLSRGESPSGESNLSGKGDQQQQHPTIEDRLINDIGGKNSLNNLRTPPTKKAKRIRFFRNGDRFYTGLVMAVTPERYRSFDSLTTDLTRALVSCVTLPNGVRSIYSMDGKKIQNIIDLEDGKSYVVSGQGELFKKVDYTSTKVRRGNSLSGLPQSPAGVVRQMITIPPFIKARIITLIRHGTKPRKVIRLLINKRNAASLDHVFEAITEVVKLDCGAVRRVYTLSGKLVIGLEQFFESEEVFLAYGSDKSSQEDFELDIEESKYVQSFKRGPCISKRSNGPNEKPVMPRKTGKRITTVPQIRTPSPSLLILPQPLRLQYSVGHVIGDGNFAVVRHCTHKTTNAEYAIKIVDKYKCQGKETMLASEVDILRQVCHPNIISLIGDQETTDQLFLVMELVKGGDLFDAIAAVTKFSEPEASVMLGHLTSALAYLHSHHIVHRDIKPENLLVEMEGSHVRCLKLGDFGLAQYVTEPLYTVCGTPTYVAPEILAETGYGLKIDVWAAGVILYILLCGFPPFVSPENDQEELFERILSGQYEFTQPYWDPISLTVKELISNMLQADPELRFTAEDVLDHPWLTSFLGGEQNPGGNSTANESSQQYGNKQCQPMRLTTYDFTTTTKHRCHSSSNIENTSGSNVTSATTGNRGFDVSFINEIKQNEKNYSRTTSADKLNGNINEKSLSLKTNKQNITTSLNDLMVNNNDGKNMKKKINSISENIHSMTYCNKNGFKKIPITSNIHSFNKKNGNSLSNIHSSIVTTTTTTASSSSSSSINNHNNKEFLLPKFSKTSCKSKRNNDFENKNSNNINDKYKINNKLSKEINSPIKRLSYSTDCLSNSSDNNIETSDSFINIQYANGKKIIKNNSSSSTQSIASSESFENINFDSEKKFEEIITTNDDKILINNPKTCNRNSRLYESNIPKFSRIPVMNGQQQLLSSRVSQNNEKPQINQAVKYREKKKPQGMDKEKKMIDNRYKRFSCLPQYLGRKKNTTDNNYRDNDNDDDVVNEHGRKLNSTNEPKQCIKSNRHSLYYTPQLRRKNYDKIDSGRKNLDNKLNNRPVSCKIAGESIGNFQNDKSDKRRNRKSIIADTNKNKSD